jgi:hypothetical protein
VPVKNVALLIVKVNAFVAAPLAMEPWRYFHWAVAHGYAWDIEDDSKKGWVAMESAGSQWPFGCNERVVPNCVKIPIGSRKIFGF